jgi:CheY-like chemotaxis protein
MTRNAFVVVFADNDAQWRASLSKSLDGKGFTVHECSNGAEAFELCRSVRPGVLLLDLDQPLADGYDTARRVRADPDLAGVILIALTRSTDELSSARAWEAGFNEFLSKPADISMVLQVIRRTQEMKAISPPDA